MSWIHMECVIWSCQNINVLLVFNINVYFTVIVLMCGRRASCLIETILWRFMNENCCQFLWSSNKCHRSSIVAHSFRECDDAINKSWFVNLVMWQYNEFLQNYACTCEFESTGDPFHFQWTDSWWFRFYVPRSVRNRSIALKFVGIFEIRNNRSVDRFS